MRNKIKKWKRLRAIAASLMAVLLLLMTTGCMGNPRSETIVIPETESEKPANEASLGKEFQVKTIYPLPVSSSSELLGWTNGEAVIGYLEDNVPQIAPSNRMQMFVPPYEQSKQLAGTTNIDLKILSLSPDGRKIAGLSESGKGTSLTLVNLEGGQVKPIADSSNGIQRTLHSRILLWSNNSRFISYLVTGNSQGQLNVVVYDVVEGTTKQFPLPGFSLENRSASVMLSNDGSSVLIEDGNLVTMAKRNGDGSFVVQYDHPSGNGGSTWIDDDRFMFLGADGTLFQYDHRNGELSVLLEKVGSFSVSPDRKLIAYTRNNEEAVYAGKLQGNNVLYQTAVYQGIVPYQMLWSLSDGALLVDGSKSQAATAQEIAPAPAADQERLRTFVIQFQ
ncbi:PD40 domain-containing protein [Paenibacillus lupini]|uniref:PD40 domain-containing protein n=1 Tax=Paenibacillus lupini TaxID=1450204 RepID=UPI00141F11A0|nr:PD40 domain-containing protein [Paenibacillus lupini]NIK22389.1 hypothetical protein [Paenibacillus lupini]